MSLGTVALEASTSKSPHLRVFYPEVLGFREENDGEIPFRLTFCSATAELHIFLKEEPQICTMRPRLRVLVQSLAGLKKRLGRLRVRYMLLRGFSPTDTRLLFLDPGGNRIEARQKWPLLGF